MDINFGPYSNRLLTRAEYERLINLKPFIHYTKEEKQFFVNLAKEYVDPHIPECGTCSGGGDAKLKIYGWFNERKDHILSLIDKMEAADRLREESKIIQNELSNADLSILNEKPAEKAEDSVEKAEKEVENYTKKKKNGRTK